MQGLMLLPQTPSVAAACCIDGIVGELWGCDPGGDPQGFTPGQPIIAHLALCGLTLSCGSMEVGLVMTSWRLSS